MAHNLAKPISPLIVTSDSLGAKREGDAVGRGQPPRKKRQTASDEMPPKEMASDQAVILEALKQTLAANKKQIAATAKELSDREQKISAMAETISEMEKRQEKANEAKKAKEKEIESLNAIMLKIVNDAKNPRDDEKVLKYATVRSHDEENDIVFGPDGEIVHQRYPELYVCLMDEGAAILTVLEHEGAVLPMSPATVVDWIRRAERVPGCHIGTTMQIPDGGCIYIEREIWEEVNARDKHWICCESGYRHVYVTSHEGC